LIFLGLTTTSAHRERLYLYAGYRHMAIVSCPECSKKLKIADTSVGKKVKCSCGRIFVAATDAAAAPPTPAAAPEKVVVSCTECGSKLKVATTSLGKKMKCPKCASVFIASVEGRAAPPPVKAMPAKDDDADDLFSFAQADAQKETKDEEEDLFNDDEDPKPKAKGKPSWRAGADKEELEDEDLPKAKGKPAKKMDEDEVVDDEEEDAPRPKTKFGAKKGAKPSRSNEDDEDAPDQKPVYPSRLLVNILVFLLAFGYMALFALVFLDVVKLPIDKPKVLAPKLKFVPKDDKAVDKDKAADKDKTKDKDADKDKAKDKDADKDKDKLPEKQTKRQKEEKAWLTGYRKMPPKDAPGASAVLAPPGIIGMAFAPAVPVFASVPRAPHLERSHENPGSSARHPASLTQFSISGTVRASRGKSVFASSDRLTSASWQKVPRLHLQFT
jgi:DNA-directed RNA polymerase subunit RPC12/RpoP